MAGRSRAEAYRARLCDAARCWRGPWRSPPAGGERATFARGLGNRRRSELAQAESDRRGRPGRAGERAAPMTLSAEELTALKPAPPSPAGAERVSLQQMRDALLAAWRVLGDLGSQTWRRAPAQIDEMRHDFCRTTNRLEAELAGRQRPLRNRSDLNAEIANARLMADSAQTVASLRGSSTPPNGKGAAPAGRLARGRACGCLKKPRALPAGARPCDLSPARRTFENHG